MYSIIDSKSDENLLGRMMKEFSLALLERDFNLVYKNQVPNVAVLVEDGAITFGNGAEWSHKVTRPALVGLQEVLSLSQSPVDVTLKAGSKISLLSRISLLKTLNRYHPRKIK